MSNRRWFIYCGISMTALGAPLALRDIGDGWTLALAAWGGALFVLGGIYERRQSARRRRQRIARLRKDRAVGVEAPGGASIVVRTDRLIVGSAGREAS